MCVCPCQRACLCVASVSLPMCVYACARVCLSVCGCTCVFVRARVVCVGLFFGLFNSFLFSSFLIIFDCRL